MNRYDDVGDYTLAALIGIHLLVMTVAIILWPFALAYEGVKKIGSSRAAPAV